MTPFSLLLLCLLTFLSLAVAPEITWEKYNADGVKWGADGKTCVIHMSFGKTRLKRNKRSWVRFKIWHRCHALLQYTVSSLQVNSILSQAFHWSKLQGWTTAWHSSLFFGIHARSKWKLWYILNNYSDSKCQYIGDGVLLHECGYQKRQVLFGYKDQKKGKAG